MVVAVQPLSVMKALTMGVSSATSSALSLRTDLLGRKVLGNQGASLKKFGKLVAQLVEEEGVNEKMAEFINPIAYLGDQMTKFTTEIGFTIAASA